MTHRLMSFTFMFCNFYVACCTHISNTAQSWLIACCSIPPVSSKYHIPCMFIWCFCASCKVCGFAQSSCVRCVFHAEPLKGQTQSSVCWRVVVVVFFNQKCLTDKFAFHLKIASVMVDNITALMRIIYEWCCVKPVAARLRLLQWGLLKFRSQQSRLLTVRGPDSY